MSAKGAPRKTPKQEWIAAWNDFDQEQRALVVALVQRTRRACMRERAPFDQDVTISHAVEAVRLGYAASLLTEHIPDTLIRCRLRQYESPPVVTTKAKQAANKRHWAAGVTRRDRKKKETQTSAPSATGADQENPSK